MGAACSNGAGDDANQRRSAQARRAYVNPASTTEGDTSTSATGVAVAADEHVIAMYNELESFAKSRKSSRRGNLNIASPTTEGGRPAEESKAVPEEDWSSVGNATGEPGEFVASVSRAFHEAKARWSVSQSEPPDATIDVPKPERIRASCRRSHQWLHSLPATGTTGVDALMSPRPAAASASQATDDSQAASAVYDELCGVVPENLPTLNEDNLEEHLHILALRVAVQRHQAAVRGGGGPSSRSLPSP